MKSGTVSTLPEVALQLCLAASHSDGGTAGKAIHQRAHEKLEADETADRIARQPEDVGPPAIVVGPAVPEWLSRLQFDLVKHFVDSLRRQRSRDQVEDTRTHSAGEDQDVGVQAGLD